MKSEGYKFLLISLIVLALIGIGFLVYRITFPEGRNNTSSPAPSPSETIVFIPAEKDTVIASLHGIIIGIDLDSSMLAILDLDTKTSAEYVLTGSTSISTKYGRAITAALLQSGDFIKAEVGSENRLISIKGSDEVWYYKNVMNLVIDDSIKRMSISDNYYHYDDSLLILSGDTFLTLADLNAQDVFTVFGVSNNINLIRVTSGHGWLSFAHDEDFIGGVISINGTVYGNLEEDMLIVLPENDYSVLIEKDDLTASATVNVSRGVISAFDLGPYGYEDVAQGVVAFSVNPGEADLYVDGVLAQDPSAVKLTYGEHTVLATLGGYTPYRGTLDVNRSDMFISISLSSAPEKAEDLLYNDDYNDYLLQYYNNLPESSDASSDTDNEEDYSDIEIPDSTTDSEINSGSTVSDSGTGSDSDNTGSGSDNTGSDSDNTGSGSDSTGSGSDSTGSGSDNTGSGSDNTGFDSVSDENNDSTQTGDTFNNEDAESTAVSDSFMTIKCTEGCAVYIDDVFKGTITGGSLRLPKQIGTVRIRLTLEGYVTRSYTVTVDDDGNDSEYAFPELVRE